MSIEGLDYRDGFLKEIELLIKTLSPTHQQRIIIIILGINDIDKSMNMIRLSSSTDKEKDTEIGG